MRSAEHLPPVGGVFIGRWRLATPFDPKLPNSALGSKMTTTALRSGGRCVKRVTFSAPKGDATAYGSCPKQNRSALHCL